MVLLAAAIATKNGKALLSRQFVEMTKPRIEGLIATFPKLITEGKQHTFIETDSVRYVYQPLEKLYVLLITTKASNILEDLETLRLFARVIPEYANGTDEASILTNAFQLIFAFDEIVALGYREDVNIGQINTFTEMDSHEERVYRAVQESKEREAKDMMKQRTRDIELARQEAAKRGGSGFSKLGRSYVQSLTGFGSDSNKSEEPRVVVARDRPFDLLPGQQEQQQQGYSAKRGTPASGVGGRAGGMKLGGAAKGLDGYVDSFVDQLRSEGVAVETGTAAGGDSQLAAGARRTGVAGLSKPGTVATKVEDLHFNIDEKMIVQVHRGGGVESFELLGIMRVLAASQAARGARIRVDTGKATGEQQTSVKLLTHPNMDKKTFMSTNWLQVKPGGKPFPENKEVGVLSWSLKTQEESMLPFSINCWPNPINGGFEVNIEYDLIKTECEFYQVVVSIPLPSGSRAPVVGNCDGDYDLTSRRGYLNWQLPVINDDNRTGSIEFTVALDHSSSGSSSSSSVDSFFPLSVSLQADRSFFDISVVEAFDEEEKPVGFSCETKLHAEKYEIV